MGTNHNKGFWAAVILGLPILVGVAIVAIGHFAGGEAEEPTVTERTGLRQAAAPAAAGTPAPEVRLLDARSGKLFDNSSFDGRPYAVVFLSTRCGPLGDTLRSALDELGGASSEASILGISADPRADTQGRVRAWLSDHHEPTTLHYLLGSARQLRPYWSAWGLTPPTRAGAASACTGTVAAHLVSAAGVNAGTVDIEAAGPGSGLSEDLGAMEK